MLYYLVLQNTTDLSIVVKKYEDSVYGGRFIIFKDINLSDLQIGEYDYYLIANPEDWDITLSVNDIEISYLTEPTLVILANKRKILADKDFILCINGKEEHPICPVDKGLLRYGDYKEEKMEYNKDTTFKSYIAK